jgi:hypothetical protein
MRINGLLNADKHFEGVFSPSKELLEDLGRFIDEVANAGVLYATDGFQPISKGTRVQLSELF